MDTNTLLLIFFAIPIAVVIISIALQKILKCPFLVAGIIFAIFLVVTFALGNTIYLVATIAYTIIAFITAFLTITFSRISRRLDREETDSNDNNTCQCRVNTSTNGIAVNANVFPNNSNNGRTGNFCGCFRRR